MKDDYETPVFQYIMDKVKTMNLNARSGDGCGSHECLRNTCSNVSCGIDDCRVNECYAHACGLNACRSNICGLNAGGEDICISNICSINKCVLDLFMTGSNGPTFSIGNSITLGTSSSPKEPKYYIYIAKQLTPERIKILEEVNKIRYKPKFDFKQWQYAMEKNDPELLTKTDIDDLFDMIGKAGDVIDRYYDARKSKISNNSNGESKI